MLKSDDIRKQSEAAYKQWCAQWREHAKAHSKMPMKSMEDFRNSGIGKAIVAVATGQSLEKHIPTLKEHQDNVDIICCDKSLGLLLENGITPTMCMVCDANVDYDRYMKPWEHLLKDTICIANVCANPKWTHNGNWKDRYFYVVKDILKSEHEFMGISGCRNVIPAGTNVSNQVVVWLTQSDNTGVRNYFGYDKILLSGYDYCWPLNGNYYAFNRTGDGKHNYMRHGYLYNLRGDYVASSGNLIFSAKWLSQYISTYKLPVVQCSNESILTTPFNGKLEEQITYLYAPEDGKRVRDTIRLKTIFEDRLKAVNKDLRETAWRHNQKYLASVN